MTDRNIRASDLDREGVVTILRDAHAEGRLTLEEFDERTTAAYAARTWGDLADLTVDLPVRPALSLREQGQQGMPTLPAVSPEATPPVPRPRPPRRGPDGRLLPALFIWAVIAAAAGSPWIAGILTVFFIGLLATRLSPRR
ncbi:MAG TPA: DUF1707 domain-containing protein [Streptosporangiaceae bacterium]|nr:DUF1707 domain-containing protein [Streptosporangiaceae bacterium]